METEERPGVGGAEAARRWAGEWVGDIAGEEAEDLREDLRGFPLERRTGLELVRGKFGREFRPGEGGSNCGA